MALTILAQADISGGPSKFDLMLALFDRKSINNRDVEFKLDNGNNLSALVVINEIGVEDGSGESWNFKGYVRRVIAGPSDRDGVPPPPRRVHGWYRTDRRKGRMELDD